MSLIIIIVFVLGYAAIAFEHPLKLNKTAPALVTGVLCWTVYAMSGAEHAEVSSELSHHLSGISEILFFLLGAMTIVELIDAHEGFTVITGRIKTTDPVKLMWIICLIAFVLAAVLDNLAASIVAVTLSRKLITNTDLRKYYAGMIIIAANAGGLWSPIGSVTTTMLWIGERITAQAAITTLILPGIINLLVPLMIMQVVLKRKLKKHFAGMTVTEDISNASTERGSALMFYIGIGALLLVPVFKTITHLPPYSGMLLSLGLVWFFSEIIHKDKDEEEKKPLSVSSALSRIDTSSVLFFLGILIAIAALESTGMLKATAVGLDKFVGNLDVIAIIIGLASAIVDNVPLVAASMGMYDINTFPIDDKLWGFLAYTAGTGGSVLIIGSAAGVAVMGMEKLDFIWFMKKISLLALLGFFAGSAVYLLLYPLLHN
ncbi:MAG: sodium:proton antiporter NhaD [Bacteroidia bacterium]|nr:sodium:proton antiporter NhaD [Bacteroidia bacterium]